ncbi:MAG: hypothetical protein RL612_487, partial [Actinomycetota bacterium]
FVRSVEASVGGLKQALALALNW